VDSALSYEEEVEKMIDFLSFAAAHGLIIDHVEQGRWVRCGTKDKPHKRNGGYFHGGDCASLINWATMTEHATWFPDKPMNEIDRADMQKRMEASHKAYAKERGRKQQVAAEKAKWMLSQCELDRHAYLDSHGMSDDVGNIWRREGKDPLLVIPMRVGKSLVGVQLISITGEKSFLTGQRCNDAEYVIGSGKLHIWCEGFCTGMAIRKAVAALKLDCAIHVCFSAGNMKRMAKSGIVIADNDKSQTGEKVAKEIGLPYFLPDVEGWDFCDIYQSRGLLKASQELRLVLTGLKKSG
jgi:putative DNA primase/helicase